MHLPKYEKTVSKVYRARDYDRAEKLFDSLVINLAGSYMNNFKFRNLRKKEITLNHFKKPVYLLTYASWCVPGKGEIPALNELAKKYKNKIDFVVLFWDKRKTTKKLAKNYHKNITVLYVDETQNKSAFVVKKLKHSLGLPTCFLLGANKEILNIQRSLFHPYQISKKESFEMNLKTINKDITTHLLPDSNVEELSGLVVTPE